MIEVIKSELIQASGWTDKILSEVTMDWNDCPPGINTNINWQIGHLTISTYFHSIACIIGSDEMIKSEMSPKKYSMWYGMGSKATENLTDKPVKSELIKNLKLIDRRVLEILNDLKESDLYTTPLLKNPVAKTKQDALLWTVKHRMWHNGQMALIKSHQV